MPPVSLNRLAADGAHMNILLKNTYLHRTLAVTNPLYFELSCSDGESPGIEVLSTRAVGMWSYLSPGEIDSRTSLWESTTPYSRVQTNTLRSRHAPIVECSPMMIA